MQAIPPAAAGILMMNMANDGSSPTMGLLSASSPSADRTSSANTTPVPPAAQPSGNLAVVVGSGAGSSPVSESVSGSPSAAAFSPGRGFGSERSVGGQGPGSSDVNGESGTSPDAGDTIRASVGHLLSRAYSLPCSTAAQAFAQLVQPTARFQLALDALLPLLDSDNNVELGQKILVSFILYSLYAPHPITVNPFKSVLFSTYARERAKAIAATEEQGVSTNEQFVWVLWKILKGDGNDIGPYSPSTLARSPLPPKLKAVNLVLDDNLYNNNIEIDDAAYSYFQNHHDHRERNGHSVPEDTANTTGTNDHPVTNGSYAMSSAMVDDRREERTIQGLRLLLVARERVLTLSEQRVLLPLIDDVTTSRLVTSLDFSPIVARNPSLAHPLFVGLLQNASEQNNNISHFLDILPFLPPTLPSMDLMGRLLRDQTFIKISGYSTVADLVRMEILGRFIHECINWIERAERDEMEGVVSDDRFAKGVQNLCRFFTSLIKLQIVDPSSDADCAEMAHFTLRYSRFEEANALYRLLVMSRY